MDSRVNDGFAVKFYADSICINYQSDTRLKDVADPKYEQEIERMLNEVKNSSKENTKQSLVKELL